jgi:hypothetical protein
MADRKELLLVEMKVVNWDQILGIKMVEKKEIHLA